MDPGLAAGVVGSRDAGFDGTSVAVAVLGSLGAAIGGLGAALGALGALPGKLGAVLDSVRPCRAADGVAGRFVGGAGKGAAGSGSIRGGLVRYRSTSRGSA